MTATILLISAVYRLRLDDMRRQFNIRLEERLAERTRIARDLHDTLLQTIQGSKLMVEGALAESSGDSEGHQVLERLSGWLDRAVAEGRTAVNSLRVSKAQEDDLVEALRQAAAEYMTHDSIKFSLSVEGVAKELHPIFREEIFHIGFEAIRNACRHSGGTTLEVELNYGRNFALRVLDDGKGIQPEVAAIGKPGHFGLRGMQERATRVGGKLSLFSSPKSGTEIELIVPWNSAYKEKPRRRFFGSLSP